MHADQLEQLQEIAKRINAELPSLHAGTVVHRDAQGAKVFGIRMEIIFSLSARIDSQDLVAWPIRNAWSWQVIADTSRGDEVVAESPRPFLPQRTAVEASVAELLVHQALITVVTQASRLSSEPRTPSTDQLQRDLNSRHVEISSALYALHEARMQAVSAAR